MNRKERFKGALNHSETDRVPIDIGGSVVTGMAATAYKKLREKLNLSKKEIQIQDLYSMTARLDEDLLIYLNIDTRFFKDDPDMELPEITEKNGYLYYSDRWGCKYARKNNSDSGFYIVEQPLNNAMTVDDIISFKWQDPLININKTWLLERAKFLKEEEKVPVILEPDIGGVFEFPCWIRGAENFYLDLAMRPEIAEAIIQKTLQYKMRYYDIILSEIGEYIDLVRESDDLASQKGLLISREMYKRFIGPAHKKIFEFIKKKCKAKICLHSCGSVRELIPDFINSGVDVINPVQTSAYGMDLSILKREFGKDIVFWGAGCDSQNVLPFASPLEVKEEVLRALKILSPGGGFICAPINMIQSDVPPENIIAFVDAVREYNNEK